MNALRQQQTPPLAVQAALKKEYFPNQVTGVPKDGDTVTVGDAELTWHALDTSDYNVNLYHFAYDLSKPAFNVVFWAVTIVNCPREIPNVRLSVGSNSASIWWVNGKEVGESSRRRLWRTRPYGDKQPWFLKTYEHQSNINDRQHESRIPQRV
jgi:hypothetical protein